MINKLITVLSTLALSTVAVAETDGFKLSGDFATSIFSESGNGTNTVTTTNGLNGSNGIGTGAYGNTTNSSNDDFSVDLAEINLEKGMGDSTIVFGIGYGRMFDRINYSIGAGSTAPKSTLNLTNAYFAHKVGDTGLSFKLGKFESFLGYESYNYADNMNYTRGHSFNFTMPWYMTGLNVNYNFNNMVDLGVYVVNSSQNTDLDENKAKHVGASVGVTPVEGLKIKLNYLTGHDGAITGSTSLASEMKAQTMNGIISYSFNNMMDFAFQYVNKTMEPVAGGAEQEISSMALYAGYKTEMFGAGLRYEMLDDKNGLAFGVPENDVNSITATVWYNVDQNTAIKAEYATHSADKQTFTKDDGSTDDGMSNYGLGLTYRF